MEIVGWWKDEIGEEPKRLCDQGALDTPQRDESLSHWLQRIDRI